MRKNALIICSYTCAVGAFGAFFRWLQNQICYDDVTKTMAPGIFNILIPLVTIAAAVVFYMLIKGLFDKGLVPPKSLYDMFHGTTLIYPIAFGLISVVTVIGGIITIASTRMDLQAGLYSLIGIFAIFTGVGFPLICTCAKHRYAPNFVSVLMFFPIALFALWLVASYRQNATIPSVSVYSIETLTLCTCLVAFYFTAGYAFGKVRPVESLLSTMFAAFLCFMTISDARYGGLQLLVCGSAGMLLVENWVIISNSRFLGDDEEKEVPSPELPAEEADDVSISPELEIELQRAVSAEEEATVKDDDGDVKIWKSGK